MEWDWMVFRGGNLGVQLLLNLTVPPLIVLLYLTPRYYTGIVEEDPSTPLWRRNLWKYVLGILYVWFFSATVWDYFIRPR